MARHCQGRQMVRMCRQVMTCFLMSAHRRVFIINLSIFSKILISNLLAIPCCKSVLCTKKCAGKANADLLNWVEMETEWKTNNTERMNMTSDQYVHITTDHGLDVFCFH